MAAASDTPVTIGVPRETAPGERRVALTPETARKLATAGARIRIERGAGLAAGFTDEAYAETGAEPVADIEVRPAQLKGIHVPEHLVPLAIDEFPVLFVAASCAQGETIVTGAEELRVKESDRIAVMAEGLKAMGVTCEVLADGIRIQGRPEGKVFSGGTVDSHGDHRIAMSFSVASLRAAAPIKILDVANVATSFPDFPGTAASAGLNVTVHG